MTEYTKIDGDTIEVLHKENVFRKDLISEKETKEARLTEINDILKELDK